MMIYTTQGLMTRDDLADHQKLTDTARHPACAGHDEGPGGWLAYCTVAETCTYEETEQ